MNKYKIALAMILKDTEPLEIITRNLSSVGKYIDGIYYTITYSGEEVSKEAKDLATQLKVFALSKGYPEPEISYFKWIKDFAAARNFNMSQIDEKYDYFMWLDADDLFRGASNLQKVAELAESVKASSVFFNYLYKVEFDVIEENGKKGIQVKDVLIEHLRERLIKNNKSYKWVGAIHETLIDQVETNKTDSDLCDVVHLSDDSRMMDAMKRNIEILEAELERQGNQKDPRIVYYLGKAYFDLRTDESFVKAEELIKRYLEGSETNTMSGWEEERGQAWEYLSEIYRQTGKFNLAIKAIANALIESPKFPQFYIDMALNYLYLKRWDKALHWVQLSQKVPYPKTTLVMNPRDMKARILEVLFNIGINTQNIDQAWAAVTELQKIFPNDPGIKERVEGLSQLRTDNQTVFNIIQLVRYLEEHGEKDKIDFVLKALPENLANEPVIASLRKDFAKPKKWGKNEITIMCGKGFEEWSPDNMAKGIGGSEEAVINMGRELTKLGWEVTVYGDPQTEKDYDGVHYRKYFNFNEKDEFNILIGWRVVQFFNTKWNAKKTYLWNHDVQNPLEYTKERVANIDKIFVLSEAHKETCINDWNKEWLTDDKFMLTGNGIDLAQFEGKKPKRNIHRCIWTSSYDRGLDNLLKMWPDIRKEVPDAELHIFYGWNLFDAIHTNNPERKAWKAKVDELMKQEGVVHHGRVGQQEVVDETFKSGFWTYPTHFYEISCITAMKCQAAGAIPVVCSYAALKETVQHGVKIPIIDKDIYDDEIKAQYKKELIGLMKKTPKELEEIRKPMMEWARNKFTWTNIAKQWTEEFK